GKYYAHRFGTPVTSYKATITVTGTSQTSVNSVTVNGVETMDDATVADNDPNVVARSIADQMNTMQITDYGARTSGNVVTITGPASAAGATPVVSNDSGGM